MKKVLSLIIVLCSLPLVAMAAPPQEPIYFGGGLGHNSETISQLGVKVDVSGTGFQFFGGYELGNLGVRNNKVNFAGEVGYMDTGNMKGDLTVLGFNLGTIEVKAKGLWANGVVRYSTSPQVDVLGRLGLDLGDDNGLMFGVGVGYWFDKKIQLRGEYVVRPDINSLQLNIVFRM